MLDNTVHHIADEVSVVDPNDARRVLWIGDVTRAGRFPLLGPGEPIVASIVGMGTIDELALDPAHSLYEIWVDQNESKY